MASCIGLILFCRLRMRPVQQELDLQWKQVIGSWEDSYLDNETQTGIGMVENSNKSKFRSRLSTCFRKNNSHNGCIHGWMGSSSAGTLNHRPLVKDRKAVSHQRVGAPCHTFRFASILPQIGRASSPHQNRQHNICVLHSQARRNEVASSFRGGSDAAALRYLSWDRHCGGTSTRMPKRSGGSIQLATLRLQRVETTPGSSGSHLLSMGSAHDRSLRHTEQHEMPRSRFWYPGTMSNALLISWSKIFAYAFPPFPLISKVLRKVKIDHCTLILIAPAWPRQY